jgi:oligoendopeptidase F
MAQMTIGAVVPVKGQGGSRIVRSERGTAVTCLAPLKAGGINHPHDIVKRAGADRATLAPQEARVTRTNSITARIKAILATEKK